MGVWERLFRRREREEELDEEVQGHLRMAAQERMEQGVTAEQARASAVREFGNVTLVKEVTRDMWGFRWLETSLQDLRYGARMLRKNPGFAVVAVLTLALGIGANVAIFSVVNATLLQPLPFRDSDRIVWIREKNHGSVAPANFLDWRRQSNAFSDTSAYFSWGANLVAQGQPRRTTRTTCSADLLRLLGVSPRLGRDFLPSDESAGHVSVVILSHSLWQESFGGDPRAVGDTVTIDGRRFTIVGIMPAGFRYPGDSDLWTTPEREVPEPPIDIGDVTKNRGIHYLTVIGRLAPGVTLDRAAVEMDTVADRLATQYHAGPRERGVIVQPLKRILVGDVRPLLLILLAAVGLVLLIACANVANLMLARARVRRAEIAVRSALGASRLRLARQMLTESLLVALAGGALGLLLSTAATRLLLRIGSEIIPHLRAVGIDATVLGFTLAASMLTGILFGLAPALGMTRVNLSEPLKQGTRQASAGRELLRGSLVVSEIALALVLLTGAGLLLRSFLGLSGQARLGFNPRGVLTFSVAPQGVTYRSATEQALFYRQALERLRALPGVREAGVVDCLPPYSQSNGSITIAEHGSHGDEQLPGGVFSVGSPGYFQALQIPLLRGRTFSAGDNAEATKVAVINQTLARVFFPHQDPIGKHVAWFTADEHGRHVWLEIVGVVGDVKNFQPGADPMPQVYATYEQENWNAGMAFAVRTASNLANVSPGVRAAIHSADPNVPVFAIQPFPEALGQALSQQRFNLLLFGLFSTLAVVLAAIGIYGVVSYMVTQRTHEIGVRIALGASRADILRMVVVKGIKLSLAGVGIGLVCAGALTRFMAGLLYGVQPFDPATFGAVSIVLTAVTLLASHFPARRATKLDPMVALRYE
ncbi:MAG: ADOP family duplicated permease [Terriglobia bacterium]